MSLFDNNSGEHDRMISAGGRTVWAFQTKASPSGKLKIRFDIETGPDSENAPEWNVALYDSSGEIWSNYRSKKDVNVDAPGKNPKEFKLEVIAPKGARYGDEVAVYVIIDADGEAFSEALAAKPDFIKPNKFELSQYFGVNDDLPPEKYAGLCGRLIERGIRTVALSMGKQGAVFAAREETLYAPGLSVRALSTVGAGDCMVGALACAFEKGLRLRDAAVLAMAASAGAVTTHGTKPPPKSLVDELMPLVKLETI